MTIYLSNVNGDWWEFDSRQPTYVLDTDSLPQTVLDEIIEEHDGLENDKFEEVIMEYGTKIYLTELI